MVAANSRESYEVLQIYQHFYRNPGIKSLVTTQV